MKYKCVNDFYIDKADDNGFSNGKQYKIKANTIWVASGDTFRVVGGEVRLEKIRSNSWIEISKERLAKNFIEIKEFKSEYKKLPYKS